MQAVAIAAIPLWVYTAKWIGKRNSYLVGIVPLIGAPLGMLFAQEGQLILIIVLAGVSGLGLSVTTVVPYTMIPDCIDYAYANTGVKREGATFSLVSLCQKFSLGISLATSSMFCTRSTHEHCRV